MAIDFTFSPEVEQARARIREFLQDTVKTRMREMRDNPDATREDWSKLIKSLRQEARSRGRSRGMNFIGSPPPGG